MMSVTRKPDMPPQMLFFFVCRMIMIAAISFCVVLHDAGPVSARAGSGGGSKSSGGSSKSSGGFSSSSKSSGSSSKYSGISRSGSSPSKYGNTSPGSPSSSGSSSAGKYGNTSGKVGSTSGASSGGTRYSNTGGIVDHGSDSKRGSEFDRKAGAAISKQQSADALRKYELEQNRYKYPGTSGSADYTKYGNTPVMTKTSYDSNSYAYRRGTFYSGAGYQPPPFAYGSHSSFGMWDAMFLWFMLDHITQPKYSQMYYNHQNDPGFQEWKKEADRLSASNGELKAKLTVLDDEVKKMSGKPIDPGYIPAGLDPDLMFDKKALDKLKKKDDSSSFFAFVIGILLLIGGVILVLMAIRRIRDKMKPPEPKYRL